MKPSIVVLGAGPAGSIAAFRLASEGRRVLLIDRPKPALQRFRVGESLPAAARPLLIKMGLLEVVDRGGHLESFGNTSVWGSDELTANDGLRDPHGLGWHLDRVRFDNDLKKAAIDAGAEPISAELIHTLSSANGFELTLSQNDRALEVETPFVIDATGRPAVFARGQGAKRIYDPRLMSVFAWFEPGADDNDTRTLVEAVCDGWWYSSRLPNQSRIVAFHSTTKHAGLLAQNPELWIEALALTRHTRKFLRDARLLTDLSCVDATGSRLDRFHGERWLAAGDAALAFDPLSSQGLLNALYTGWLAGEAAIYADVPGRYGTQMESIREAYVRNRRTYYATETRFQSAPFWRNSSGF